MYYTTIELYIIYIGNNIQKEIMSLLTVFIPLKHLYNTQMLIIFVMSNKELFT